MIDLRLGDCLEQMKAMPDGSVDAIVTDPPYGLAFMGKKWDYDVPSVDVWREALRVLKPGGHLLSFGGTRTYHRMVVAIEDAGFEIRDQIQWLYGSGFPKSLDVSKAIDKAAGAEREVVGINPSSRPNSKKEGMRGFDNREGAPDESAGLQTLTAPSTDLAKQWQGWGTALKPANEPIVLARKPLAPKHTVAQNVAAFGTGALNIDASRIATNDKPQKLNGSFSFSGSGGANELGKKIELVDAGLGRWPANIVLDEAAAEVLDSQAEAVSRFFYVAKANKRERNAGLEGLEGLEGREVHRFGAGIGQGKDPSAPAVDKNHHPTIKPIALMEYLVRLVTPPGGTCLDPFMGSGTTGVAAAKLGFSFLGIEMNEEYLEIARRRIAHFEKSSGTSLIGTLLCCEAPGQVRDRRKGRILKRVTFDFETRSACNLKTAGAFKYSKDPTTQPTCMAFKLKWSPTVFFFDFKQINSHWSDLDLPLKQLWQSLVEDPEYLFSAHNAFFETCIYKNILVARYGWPDISSRRFRCTAAKAAACALPRNLEGAGEAMRLTTQKDKRGYAAMMATCKPTKQWTAWRKMQAEIKVRLDCQKYLTPRQERWLDAQIECPPMLLEPEAAPAVWNTLYEYCKIDVLTEELLDRSLPDLIPQEQRIWFLNQKLNWRGLRIDIPLVKRIVGIMEAESKMKLKELDALTMGLVTKPGARASILEFLALEGIELPDIRAKTVDDALSGDALSGDMRRLLEIRQALSKTSTKKYQAFLHRAMPDGRCRDILLYHGASTGRDTGTGLQPHNFPRGLIRFDKSDPYEPVNNVVECEPEMLRLLYGESLSVLFSSILRNMIIPSEGSELYVADFSKIEVAVLWWLAGNKPGLKILRDGLDPYIYMAAANTGKSYEEIEKALFAEEKWAIDARQLGKAQVLGCGFGMGWQKFQSTAFDQYRLRLTDVQSEGAVAKYREQNSAVTDLWKEYERCAIAAVEENGTAEAQRCKFIAEKKFLWIELPSGRRLAYREPTIAWRANSREVTKYFWRKKWRTKASLERQGLAESEIQKCPTKTKTVIGEPRETLEYWAVNPKTKKWNVERTWGGTLVQGVTQAVARDLMMLASVRLEKAGYKFLLSVHDEAITEKPIGEGSIEEFTKIMCALPAWAGDMPVEAKGWRGPRYRK